MNTNVIVFLQSKLIELTFILAFGGGNIKSNIDISKPLHQGQNSKEMKMKVNLSGFWTPDMCVKM